MTSGESTSGLRARCSWSATSLTDSRGKQLAGTAFVDAVAEGDENIFVDQPKLGVVRDLKRAARRAAADRARSGED